MRRRTIVIEQPAPTQIPDSPPWTEALDPGGRLVMAAVEFGGEWTIYLALDGKPLSFDVQAIAGSFEKN
jgi:hypothetical protein